MKRRIPYIGSSRDTRAFVRVRVLAAAGSVVLSAALLTACDDTGSDGSASITMGVGGNIFDMPIRIAAAKGYFAKQGLNVKVVTLNPSIATTALESDSVQFLNSSPTTFLSALSRDLKETAIAHDGDGNPLGLVVSTDFARKHHLTADTPPDQVAKALVGSTGGSSSTNTKAQAGIFLKAYGVEPDDIKWVSLLSPAANEASLKTGQIGWFATSEPTPLEIEHSGDGLVLADAARVPVWSNDKVGYGQLLVARSSYLRDHPAIAKKTATAVQQATAYLHTHLDSATVKNTAKETLPGVPASVIDKSLPLVNWPTSAKMSNADWKTTVSFINELHTLRGNIEMTTDNWTNSYLP
ncbi:ABC transporter substrate-binding protein [Streptomyces sp. NPDC059785]|uniref:ABC transporter substrate-binding protein n=1 Tax=Streptomyces sp. NPDC059785 TaxID=3346945 RepID=UPI00365D6AFE